MNSFESEKKSNPSPRNKAVELSFFASRETENLLYFVVLQSPEETSI